MSQYQIEVLKPCLLVVTVWKFQNHLSVENFDLSFSIFCRFFKSWSIFWNFGRFSLDLWESHSMASPNNSFSHEQHVSNKSRNCLGRDQSHDKINLLIGANPRPIGELWVFLIFTYHFYRGTHIDSGKRFYYCMLGVCCNWWKREC